MTAGAMTAGAMTVGAIAAGAIISSAIASGAITYGAVGAGAVTARTEYRGAIAIDYKGVVHFTVIKHSDVVGDAESRCHRFDAAKWS